MGGCGNSITAGRGGEGDGAVLIVMPKLRRQNVMADLSGPLLPVKRLPGARCSWPFSLHPPSGELISPSSHFHNHKILHSEHLSRTLVSVNSNVNLLDERARDNAEVSANEEASKSVAVLAYIKFLYHQQCVVMAQVDDEG